MLIFLYGDDSYRSRQKLDEIKEKYLREVDPSGFNLTIADGGDLDGEKFAQIFSTASFFAVKRMVVVNNFFNKNKTAKAADKILEILERKESDKDNIVVFWEDAVGGDKKKKSPLAGPLFQKLAKSKFSQEFKSLSGEALADWIAQAVKKEGAEIGDEAAEILAAMTGGDLWQAASEVKKLAHYKKGGEITADDVRKNVSAAAESNFFALLDALGGKNKRLALTLLEQELSGGSDELHLLASIASHFRNLLQAREMLDANGYARREDAAVKLGIHPFVAQKALAQARNFTLEELGKIYRLIEETDKGVKTGSAKARVAVTVMAGKVCDCRSKTL